MPAIGLLFALILFSHQGWCRTDDANSATSMVQKIEKLRAVLRTSAYASKACDTPQGSLCSFEKMCSQFDSKSQDFYLYQNEEGYKVPNFNLIIQANLAELCLPKVPTEVAVKDPFAYPQQFFSESSAGGKDALKQNQENLKKKMVRVEVLFKQVQAKVIKVLEAKKNSQNSAEIATMIERVRTVKLKSPNLSEGAVGVYMMGCEAPNAFYDPTQHEMIVCPQFLNYPTAALFATLSHEFGHSIDPCVSMQDFKKDKTGNIGMVIPEFLGGDGGKGKVVFSGIAPNKNPFGQVISCLQSENSIGAKVPTLEKLLSPLDEEEQNIVQNDADLEDVYSGAKEYKDATRARIQDQKDLIKENYEQFKYCGRFSQNGHLQESFSDWIESQTVADYISELQDPFQAKKFAFEAQAVFWGTECSNIGDNVSSRMEAIRGNGCKGLEMATPSTGKEEAASHPLSSRRIDRILMANPTISKALGCKASSGVVECK